MGYNNDCLIQVLLISPYLEKEIESYLSHFEPEWNLNSTHRFLIPSLYPLRHSYIQAYSTWFSRTITHVGNIQVRSCLTSAIRWEAVFQHDIAVSHYRFNSLCFCLNYFVNNNKLCLEKIKLNINWYLDITSLQQRSRTSKSVTSSDLAHTHAPELSYPNIIEAGEIN